MRRLRSYSPLLCFLAAIQLIFAEIRFQWLAVRQLLDRLTVNLEHSDRKSLYMMAPFSGTPNASLPFNLNLLKLTLAYARSMQLQHHTPHSRLQRQTPNANVLSPPPAALHCIAWQLKPPNLIQAYMMQLMFVVILSNARPSGLYDQTTPYQAHTPRFEAPDINRHLTEWTVLKQRTLQQVSAV
ncbi:hypothetical protein BDP55DRAFT_720532 [Colletotrichum godetiae]|uniref:Uncharacterized protein n=1 Tax=Colletotrichum godetiae TaxID=1209918 RepID=A0AAJ0AA11_9PEZI|nr:uncharacterized protein BDP55DRAFT_720532 [Colletotrichum godetiae]KAK1658598.1 hypothetical protein BDP55DRAFT_720532 [Colletotrichum godetiae]